MSILKYWRPVLLDSGESAEVLLEIDTMRIMNRMEPKAKRSKRRQARDLSGAIKARIVSAGFSAKQGLHRG